MDHKTYETLAGMIFGVIALFHLARIVFGWDAMIGGWEVPTWISWIAVLLGGFLAYMGLSKIRK